MAFFMALFLIKTLTEYSIFLPRFLRMIFAWKVFCHPVFEVNPLSLLNPLLAVTVYKSASKV
jgi:hypothetical protein